MKLCLCKNNGFLLCSAHEKALSKWDVVYEIVAVTSNVCIMVIDFLPILIHTLVILKILSKRKVYCSYPL